MNLYLLETLDWDFWNFLVSIQPSEINSLFLILLMSGVLCVNACLMYWSSFKCWDLGTSLETTFHKPTGLLIILLNWSSEN